MVDALQKEFSAFIPITKATETADGRLILHGPVADTEEDYDGEVLEKAGVLKGLATWDKLGRHVDYEHLYAKTHDPEVLIGKGLRYGDDEKGIPQAEVELYKDLPLAQKVWKAVQRGVHMGFSMEGFATMRDPKNSKHVLETEIHRLTISPSPKGYNQSLTPGPASLTILAKALIDMAEAGATEGWEPVNYATPIAKARAPIEGRKMSKPQSHYKDDAGNWRCSKCDHFDTKDANSCAIVKGVIAPDALCDYFEMRAVKKATPTSSGERPTHAEWSKRAKLSTPCTAAHTTFGGECLNCGWKPNPTDSFKKRAVKKATGISGKCKECGQSCRCAGTGKCKACGERCGHARKAMTTDEGIVPAGASGGRALRTQELRGKLATVRSCPKCNSKMRGGKCTSCAFRQSENLKKSPAISKLRDRLAECGAINPGAVEQALTEKGYVGFNKLKSKLRRRGVRDPGAVAAAVGRAKYGKRAYQSYAERGKKMRNVGESG